MGKVKLLVFSNEKLCDLIERNYELSAEQIHVGMATFDAILPPAFSDTYGTEYRFYDRNNPYALIPIVEEEDIERYKIVLKSDGYKQKEIDEMISLLTKNKELKRLDESIIKELQVKGYKPVYRGFKLVMFRKMQFETWYSKIFAHTPELNHTLFNNTHGKNTFGTSETKREAFFAFAGFLFGVIMLLAICLPIITYLGAQI